MNKLVLSFFLKISSMTFVFFIIISWITGVIGLENITLADSEVPNPNKHLYVVASEPVIADIWVALSTNLGTRYKQQQELPATIYKDIVSIGYILANKQVARDKIISTNMIFLNEYKNVLRTDVKSLIWSSTDRSEMLDVFISQLEYRYRASAESKKTLSMQADKLKSDISASVQKIESAKKKMWEDFANFDSLSTGKNIDDYLQYREEYEYARTYLVFIGKFNGYYNILDEYNKKLLDALINNKEAIVKWTQIVIPDTGTDVLRELDLLYDEAEWKSGSRE